MMNPRDIAGKAEEEEEGGEPQRYSWEHRRRRGMVNPRDIAGKAEEEEEEEALGQRCPIQAQEQL